MMKRNILLIPLVAGCVTMATTRILGADLAPDTTVPVPTPILAAPTQAADLAEPVAATAPETPAAPAPTIAPTPMPRVEHVVVPKPPKPPKAPKLVAPPPLPHVAKTSPDMVEDLDVDEDLGVAVLDEERDLDVQKAIKRYQAEMDKFERQCNQAADAAGNLLVSCDKLGQQRLAETQLERLRKKLEMQLALVATLQKKSAELAVKSPDARPQKELRTTVRRGKANPTAGIAFTKPGDAPEAVFIPDGPGHEEELMDPAMEEGEDNEIPAVKRARDMVDVMAVKRAREMADANGNINAQQQAAMRGMQEQLKKLQAEMSALRDMKSSLRISDEVREKLEDARADLELAKVNQRNAQKQIEEARKKRDAVMRGRPEHLPPPADTDAQYTRLRDELTNLELAQANNSDTNAVIQHKKSLEEAFEKLTKYVKEVYAPAVESAAKFAAEQYDNANMQVDEYRKRYQSLQREIEKSAVKEGKPPKEKKPGNEAPVYDGPPEKIQKY